LTSGGRAASPASSISRVSTTVMVLRTLSFIASPWG
jgi:hypothetical protein